MEETNIIKYCYSTALEEQLWRGMFLAHILGIDIPTDMKICTLPDTLSNPIKNTEFSPALASLLILYGGGYIDNNDFLYIYPNCKEYTKELAEIETLLFNQSDDNPNDKLNAKLIKNALLCVINSRKYEEIQPIEIPTALALCRGKYTTVVDGFVHLRDKDYMNILSENDIKFGCINKNGKNISIGKYMPEQIRTEFQNGSLNGLKEFVEKLADGYNPSEPTIKNCILLDINDFLYITSVYKKPYYKEFLKYAKAQNIPYSNDLEEKYKQYVLKYKNTFKLKVYPRARHICHKYPNWFDYNLPENNSIRDLDIDITESLKKGEEYDDDYLLDTAVVKAFTDREYDNDTVLEFRHGDEIIYFIVVASHKVKRLDNETFHKIPFDFNNIWTTITEWSRDKKIRKSVIDGQTEISVVPESEWEKIKPEDREYAKRLIIEQMQLHEEELKQNMFIQKLSDMKSNASNELKAKQEEAEKKAQEKEAEKNKHKLTFNQRKGGTGQ